MTEIPIFDGKDPHDMGDKARDAAAAAFTESDAETFANLLAQEPSPESNTVTQTHSLGEEALKNTGSMDLDDLLRDIQEKGE